MNHIRHNPLGLKFNPRENCHNEVQYVEDPKATTQQMEKGIKMVFKELEDSMRKFIPPEFRRRVQFYRVNPMPPMGGRLGWRYIKP